MDTNDAKGKLTKQPLDEDEEYIIYEILSGEGVWNPELHKKAEAEIDEIVKAYGLEGHEFKGYANEFYGDDAIFHIEMPDGRDLVFKAENPYMARTIWENLF